jgi:diguanylate cyclase (GGDEF)-like protein
MDIDLFKSEQQVYDDAMRYVEDVRGGADFNFDEYAKLTKEYGRLLKQLRRATRLADRTSGNLHVTTLDLNGKVNYDALTGIYNRRYMEDKMKSIVNTIARTGAGGSLSVMMMDVDNFKKYNDTYGHAQGDTCLKAIADALSASVTRADDFVARYGGEEFTVVLPNTDEAGARKIADLILENVRAKNITHEKNEGGIATISIGITTGKVEYSQNCDEYIKCADKALYMSKMGGRNRYTYINFKEGGP